MMLESISAWYRLPLHAALDADASDVRRNPEDWAQWLGDVTTQVSVEWVTRPTGPRGRDRFLDPMGDFKSARHLVSFAATGQR